MTLPTEPIGSIPRPLGLLSAIQRVGNDDHPDLTDLAGERDRVKVLKTIRRYMKPNQRIFVGVVAPIDPRAETAEEVRDRVLEAAEFIPAAQLGTTDDCGFSPFCDDTSTSRETAFTKIRARVAGTALASAVLGV